MTRKRGSMGYKNGQQQRISSETASFPNLEDDACIVVWNSGYRNPYIKGKMNFSIDNVIIHVLYEIP